MGDTIEFTVNEQNCLALLCQMMSSFAFKAQQDPETAPNVENELCDIVERFPSTNWGGLYDKFHRQGKNR